MFSTGLLPGGGDGGRGGGGPSLLRWLGLRMWSRQGTLVFALLWFSSWVFLNGLVLVHRRVLSDYCSDDKTKRILQRLVSQVITDQSAPTPHCPHLWFSLIIVNRQLNHLLPVDAFKQSVKHPPEACPRPPPSPVFAAAVTCVMCMSSPED